MRRYKLALCKQELAASLTKAGRVLIILLSGVFALGPSAQAQSAPAQAAAAIPTGPAIGEKIPAFRALDQNGRMQDFDSIRGPKGAVIVFNRSTDW